MAARLPVARPQSSRLSIPATEGHEGENPVGPAVPHFIHKALLPFKPQSPTLQPQAASAGAHQRTIQSGPSVTWNNFSQRGNVSRGLFMKSA